MLAVALIVGVGLLPPATQAQGFFINPPPAGRGEFFLDNPVYTIDDEIEVSWFTGLDQYSILLLQQSLGVAVATIGPSIYSSLATRSIFVK